jgi:glycosyltransferase involved in cell wall biosynthesis
MKIVSLIEAATVNAVAKGAIDYIRTSRQLAEQSGDVETVEGTFITFDRRLDYRETPNEFVLASRAAEIEINVIPERRRFDLSVIPKLRALIEQRQPDLVVTHSVKSHFVMWRSGLAKKYPWLAFHHGYTTTDRKMRIYNRLDRWTLPKADQILTVCHAFARQLAEITRIPVERILVQHNAVRPRPAPPAQAVEALRERLGIAGDESVILSIGRLSREKAQADLIAAFNQLCEQYQDLNCKLVIVGDGPERAQLELAAQTSPAANRIVLAGCTNNVQPFYALANIFALPSRSEGSPNVLLEAMAAGVPVVAATVGGVPEIVVNEESALLVDARNPSSLAAAIARVLRSRELEQRLMANARDLVTTKYQPELYARNLTRIYGSVIEARRATEA